MLRKSILKKWVKKRPLLSLIAKLVYFGMIERLKSFSGSEEYWIQRYKSGGSSGDGSQDKFAQFKAEILNDFVRKKEINTVIEFGCGDGNQLTLSEYPSYIGFDVSQEAILRCKKLFQNDDSKSFKLMEDYENEKAELTLSLDVIYHLIEDETFFSYMHLLFNSSTRFVIIYSSNTEKQAKLQASHIRHREFTKWIELNCPQWELLQYIPNRYPYDKRKFGSFADFYIYKRVI